MDREKFYRLLRLGIEKGASDIHFQVGNLPLYRFNGNLVELRYKVLTGEDTEEIARLLLEGDERGAEMAFNEIDLAYELAGEGRFRVNISRQRKFFNIVLRVIPFEIPTFEQLRLPKVLRQRRNRKLSVRLTATVNDPAGHTRTVKSTIRLKSKRMATR